MCTIEVSTTVFTQEDVEAREQSVAGKRSVVDKAYDSVISHARTNFREGKSGLKLTTGFNGGTCTGENLRLLHEKLSEVFGAENVKVDPGYSFRPETSFVAQIAF